MEEFLSDDRASFQDFKTFAEILIGKEDSEDYFRRNKKLSENVYFYTDNCKVFFITRSISNCNLTTASKKFKANTYWATFHPNWKSAFGKLVVRKNTEELLTTTDYEKVLKILSTQIAE
jgi:hypothetical protein